MSQHVESFRFGAIPSENRLPSDVRRSADFHPSPWGDHFDKLSQDHMEEEAWTKRIEELKGEVKKLLINANEPLEQIELIDSLQRLGVAYHFEKKIEETLDLMYHTLTEAPDDDLHAVSLRFRLLRQQGYRVSCDVFNKFRDEQGKFKKGLARDARGILSLYEAAHLSTQGEYVFDEAIDFTRSNLMSIMESLPSPLSKLVEHALELPLQKRMPRLEARYYITVYQDEESRNEALNELAKLDFNLLQSVHKRELSDISRWWRSIDFTSKLPFARDRLVECYFWILGVNFEPRYRLGRIAVTKLISITSVIDDIYDVYGTLEELKSFTDAIPRWDIEATNQLPEYMKVCYLALLDVVNEIEEEMNREGRSYVVHYVKEAMNALCRSYLAEAIWYSEGYVPTLEEYLNVAVISSGYPMLSVQALIGLGDVATKEAFDWVISVPMIVRAASMIGRLVDDVQTHKAEQERGDAASAVQCYMKENNVSEEEACERLREMVKIAWKDINNGCLQPTLYPLPLLKPILNFARVIEVMYQHGDGYSDSTGSTKHHITSLLVEKI